MTDRELLKRAARAAGIEHPGGDHSRYDDGRLWDCDALRWWNPLHDDGDALRLAIKLGISIRIYGDEVGTDGCHEPYGPDPDAAVRRAIVRAAAAMVDAKGSS
jgi:hypothetical protein